VENYFAVARPCSYLSFVLLKKMVVHENPDKISADKIPDRRDAIYPLSPSRVLIAGAPGCGKGNMALRIIGEHPIPYDTISVVHLCPEETDEYKILGDNVKMLNEMDLPSPEDFARDKRNLVIIDEVSSIGKPAAWKKRLDRLFNFTSTHKNATIFYLVQNAFDAPVGVRRACSAFCLFKSPDTTMIKTLGRRLGIKDMHEIFDELNFGKHDSLWIDMSGSGPTLRKNLTQVIQQSD
jgi:hypothetical protein